MSYEIVFWKGSAANLAPRDVYYRLNEKEFIEGIDEIPLDDIIDRVRAEYPGLEQSGSVLDWSGPDGSFQLTTTGQHVRFDCYGMSRAEINRIIDIMADFGCALYDPQIDTRFSLQNGRA